jgi:acyl-CoA synthetase (AMP-forming)/AMP-acid ligase II
MHLTMLLDMAADGFGDRRAVGTTDAAITAGELRQRAWTGARVLREREASALIYLTTNGTAFPVAMFSAAYAGVPLVPLNYRLGAAQLSELLSRHPKALVIAAPGAHDLVDAAGLPAITTAQWIEATAGDPGEVVPDVDFDSPAVIIYTSGTTSAPKGVLLRHQNLVSYVIGTVEYMSADEDDVALVCVPPYHIAAVANCVTNLYAGRRTVVLDHFDAGDWLATVRAEQVTNALVVPTMLARIVEHCIDRDSGDIDSDSGDKAVPSLRTLAYGGAPMPARIIERALEMWPKVGFVNAYGLTETSSTVAVLGPEDHRAALASSDPAVRARLGSAGRVIPTVDLAILDSVGNELPTGAVGRICLRGEQVSAEYAGIGRAVDDNGFFDTRDEGYVDEEGFLFIGGRVDDTIIRGGENIAPAEIEAVLMEDPSVGDVAVIGVPDDEWGQRIEAVVVPMPGGSVDPEALRALVRSKLRGSKTPDRIHVLEELPRTETGKLIRRQIRGLLPALSPALGGRALQDVHRARVPEADHVGQPDPGTLDLAVARLTAQVGRHLVDVGDPGGGDGVPLGLKPAGDVDRRAGVAPGRAGVEEVGRAPGGHSRRLS